jgi:hypothetical protein
MEGAPVPKVPDRYRPMAKNSAAAQVPICTGEWIHWRASVSALVPWEN